MGISVEVCICVIGVIIRSVDEQWHCFISFP